MRFWVSLCLPELVHTGTDGHVLVSQAVPRETAAYGLGQGPFDTGGEMVEGIGVTVVDIGPLDSPHLVDPGPALFWTKAPKIDRNPKRILVHHVVVDIVDVHVVVPILA